MRPRRRQTFDALSVSALDLFASSLGVFMLLSLMLFPFFLKQPAVQARLQAARAEHGAAAAGLAAAVAAERQAAAAQQRAAAALTAAAAERDRAATEAAAAATQAAVTRSAARAAAAAQAAAAPPRPPAPVAPPQTGGKPGVAIAALDLVLVMDTTGSMRDEIADVQASLVGTLNVLGRLTGSLRVGFVAYKDRGEAYVTRVLPLRPVGGGAEAEIVAFVRSITAGGGGDEPEAVDDALAAAVAMAWRPEAEGRILVIGDARARPDGSARALAQAAAFRASAGVPGQRTVGSVFTGRAPADRAFFQQLAAAGGGDFAQNPGRIIEAVMLSVVRERGAAP